MLHINRTEIEDKAIYPVLFADDQLLITQFYEDLEYMTRKLIEENDFWGLQLNVVKTKYMTMLEKDGEDQLDQSCEK